MATKLQKLFFLFFAVLFCQQLLAANINKLADDDWIYITSKNFEVVTDLDKEKAQHLVEDLEAYRFFSIQMMKLQILPNLKPLKILAISNDSNFKNLGFPETWAGVFNLDTFGYSAIANVSNYKVTLKTSTLARQVLFHEYNHFLMRFTENTLHYPMWYDEGMADYWGSFKFDGKKIYIGDPAALGSRLEDLVNATGNIVLDSEKLFNTNDMPMTSTSTKAKVALGSFYSQSFFMIHYFNSTPELRVSLSNYIQYLNGGYNESDAFQKAFNTTYAELDKNAKRYLQRNLTMRVIGAQEGSVHFPKPQTTISGLNEASFYNQLSTILPNYDVVDKRDIKTLLEKNIELNPNDANAKALLLINNLATDTQKIINDIEQTDSQNALLLTYKGNILKSKANVLRKAGIADWELQMNKARDYYRNAIVSNPSFPLPYSGLGETYNFVSDSEKLDEGITGLNIASLYARKKTTFANLADMYIRSNRGLEALPSLRNTIAFGKGKDKSTYSLILENLEILNDITNKNHELVDGKIYFPNVIYQGQITKGVANGFGKITRPNDSYFEGYFVDGVMHGKGKLVTQNGFVYEGQFEKGIARGHATITYPEGSSLIRYSGDVYYGAPHGKGIQTSKTGIYEGEFWHSLYLGDGTFKTQSEEKLFAGNWIYGRYEWPELNGTTFIGAADETGKRNGRGLCVSNKNSTAAKIDWCIYKDDVFQQKPTTFASNSNSIKHDSANEKMQASINKN